MTARSVRGIAALVVIAIAAALVLFLTDQGAGVIARARCVPSWLLSDRTAYQACYDVEREQIVEDRAKRHTRFDE